MHAFKIPRSRLLHGEIDGTKDYVSGLNNLLYINPDNSKAIQQWRRTHEIGMSRWVGR